MLVRLDKFLTVKAACGLCATLPTTLTDECPKRVRCSAFIDQSDIKQRHKWVMLTGGLHPPKLYYSTVTKNTIHTYTS